MVDSATIEAAIWYTIENMDFILSSPAFKEGETIPVKYTCDGENINPPLYIEGVPPEARSLALIVEDPDVPKAVRDSQMFDHWLLFNISPTVTEIPEGENLGILGANTAGNAAYTGPCPPPQFEPKEHRYVFQLYALDQELDVREGAGKEVIKTAMKGHIIAKAELVGKYSRG